jgi:hypothetical protein
MADYGEGQEAPLIEGNPSAFAAFAKAWRNYGPEKFFNYGRLPQGRAMINWPIHGNDYGEGVGRLVGSERDRNSFYQDAIAHSHNFAAYIQQQLGRRYGLAPEMFPPSAFGGGSFALQPYFREARRLVGLTTVTELDILPMTGGTVAPLPLGHDGSIRAIALGNYANDHHYPSGDIPLAPKSIQWGGRWTGTPFTIPYEALIPEQVEGFLACDKNISVSHMANGATRLQPVVLAIGQAAGMAASLCIQHHCQPRDLPVRLLQEALLTEPTAPSAIVPFYNLSPNHPDWVIHQRRILDQPETYPSDGWVGDLAPVPPPLITAEANRLVQLTGQFQRPTPQTYELVVDSQTHWTLVTQEAAVHEQLKAMAKGQLETIAMGEVVQVKGWLNSSGGWMRIYDIRSTD